jgi:ribosome-associated toxin RatA of RatAB toxin-antitoxin module
MPAAQRSIDVDVAPSALMAVLVDFAKYPTFLADMEEAVVLRGEPTAAPSVWTVKFSVRIIRRLSYTLRLERDGDRALRWTLVEGMFRSNNGGWTLEPLDGGARTRATYALDVDIGMFVPGSVSKTLLEHNLPATLAAFKARAESLARGG